MNTKLTLSINKLVIQEAKKYLQDQEQSLSGLVEDYFKLLLQTRNKNTNKTTLVGELAGIAKNDQNNSEVLIVDYLHDKYK